MFLYVQYVYEQCRFSYGHALHVSKVHMCMYRVQSVCVTICVSKVCVSCMNIKKTMTLHHIKNYSTYRY
jgi:hypothetical protein